MNVRVIAEHLRKLGYFNIKLDQKLNAIRERLDIEKSEDRARAYMHARENTLKALQWYRHGVDYHVDAALKHLARLDPAAALAGEESAETKARMMIMRPDKVGSKDLNFRRVSELKREG